MERKDKPRLLMVAPLPPPIHGSAMVSMSMKESRVLGRQYVMDWVNLSTSRKMEEIDKRTKRLIARKAVRFATSYARTLWLLMTQRYDLCYLAITCHGIGFLKDAPFVLLCKMFGRKVVIHQHNKGMARDVDRPLYRWLLHKVYGKSWVILLSWHLYPDITRVVCKSQVRICANGINRTLEWPLGRPNNEVPHLLFLSNLMVEKGVMVLLDALQMLKERGVTVVCDFVGSETRDVDSHRIEEEIRNRGLEGMAIYHGRKYGKEKDAYFRKADIFVFPTYYFNECLPLVILEAMEYGLPVISTNEGGIRDEVIDGRNGYVVETRNAAALADAIERLVANSMLRKRMGDEGRQMFEMKFTMKKFEVRMCEVLHDCIQSMV